LSRYEFKFQLNSDVSLNLYKCGTNCAVNKHTKISVKIRVSADIQNVKYRSFCSGDHSGGDQSVVLQWRPLWSILQLV